MVYESGTYWAAKSNEKNFLSEVLYKSVYVKVDKRLAEMQEGFASGHLAVGDTGDSARDLHNIYSIPTGRSPETNSPPLTAPANQAGPNSLPSSSS